MSGRLGMLGGTTPSCGGVGWRDAAGGGRGSGGNVAGGAGEVVGGSTGMLA